jgi:hypothetical protein
LKSPSSLPLALFSQSEIIGCVMCLIIFSFHSFLSLFHSSFFFLTFFFLLFFFFFFSSFFFSSFFFIPFFDFLFSTSLPGTPWRTQRRCNKRGSSPWRRCPLVLYTFCLKTLYILFSLRVLWSQRPHPPPPPPMVQSNADVL